jgi:dTDP-glucose 4,6-dehydratase
MGSIDSLKHTVQRCAVLGSNSFAGAAFVAKAIEDGVEVVGFNRSPEGAPIFLPYRRSHNAGLYRYVCADINRDLDRIARELEEFRPQAIVDFAGQGMVAESWANPEQWYTTNLLAKVRLHERLRTYSWLNKYVRISTPEVYGSSNDRLDENHPYNPTTPYAVSHAAIDMSLAALHQQYGFPVVIGRFANFFGAGQQLYRIVPRTIIYALLGKKLQLHGGGHSTRAFIHSADVSAGIAACLVSGIPGQKYHFAPERFLTIRQAVELICRRLGTSFESFVEISADRPGKDMAYLMDSSKARRELGWRETMTFEQGVDETISWVRDNLDQIKQLPLDYIHKP